MALFTHDMTTVQAMDGSNVPDGWYHIRVEKGEVRESKETPGEEVWWLWLKVQQEDFLGRIIMDTCSLQPTGLGKLKNYYEKCGYKPGPEGHDPEQLNGMEFYVKVEESTYKGEKRTTIKPWNIRSVEEGIPAGA
ncbi:hypothetical protein LCGC14_2895250 [marine sediment metagenome]|uniref:Uncharacterized protein n=1 Tax=marine sediment metagenome TaxID=412755 RepID=A0A0F9A3V9_9ZZZZ